jgi:hypothetical protein
VYLVSVGERSSLGRNVGGVTMGQLNYEQQGVRIFLEQLLRDVKKKDVQVEFINVSQIIYAGEKKTHGEVTLKYTIQ